VKQDSVALDVDSDLEAERAREAQVVSGLMESPPRISPVWFYDRRGSALFERICALPEYYLTRTELDIMRRHVGDMAAALGERVTIIEPGSGASVKTRLLLDALRATAAYVPVDISREHLLVAATRLRRDYPRLRVQPVCADFTASLEVPAAAAQGALRRVVYFPGSTLGNFAMADATRLLARFAAAAGPAGAVLLGLDRVKPTSMLVRAYDDAEGVTAEFNLNALRHLNRDVGTDFELDGFDHRAVWVAAHERIEMHLVARRAQQFSLGSTTFRLDRGQYLLTEYSHKYTLESASDIAASAGLAVRRVWSDQQDWFSVLLLEPA
jgi:dimethylhistidine N-methyltransferase